MISTLAKVTGCSTRRQNLFTCCFHLQPIQTLFQSAAIRYDTCLWYHNIMLSREFFVHSLRTTLARGILFPSTWPDWPGGFISGAFLPSPFFSSLFRCWRLLYHFWKIFANSFFPLNFAQLFLSSSECSRGAHERQHFYGASPYGLTWDLFTHLGKEKKMWRSGNGIAIIMSLTLHKLVSYGLWRNICVWIKMRWSAYDNFTKNLFRLTNCQIFNQTEN